MDPANLSTKRQWIAELARSKPNTALFLLHHVIDLEWMQEAYRLTRKDGATGIDGVTAAEYEANLRANLADLLERIKSGRYKAPPVRRTYIPKADGSQRHPDLRRQSGATGDRHGSGGRLRAGLSLMLVRLPAATLGACGATRTSRRTHAAGTVLGAGRRHTQVLRLDSTLSPAGVSRPASDRRRHPTDDRQVAEGGSPGRRAPAACD